VIAAYSTAPGPAVRSRAADAYGELVAHAAAGRVTVDLETVPLAEVREAWRRQAAYPRRKRVIAP